MLPVETLFLGDRLIDNAYRPDGIENFIVSQTVNISALFIQTIVTIALKEDKLEIAILQIMIIFLHPVEN